MGYIRLDRKFFENAYWKQKRTFSLSEAWLDLIQLARFDAEPTQIILPNGRMITIERGEIHASLRFLSDRWGWSVDKTLRYINKHKEKQEIKHRTQQGETLLSLCNYDKYNPLPNTDKYTKPNTDQYTDQTPTSTNNNKDKESKERKKEKEFSNENYDEDVVVITPEENFDFSKFNSEKIVDCYHAVCISFPRVKVFEKNRKDKVKLRFKEMEKAGLNPYETFQTVFELIENSDFCKGGSKSGWKATFDWVIENGKNWVKILEGNYENREQQNTQRKSILQKNAESAERVRKIFEQQKQNNDE